MKLARSIKREWHTWGKAFLFECLLFQSQHVLPIMCGVAVWLQVFLFAIALMYAL